MFIPHTAQERDQMLAQIGVGHIADLFQDVPEKFRFPNLNLPSALSEMEVLDTLQDFSATNETSRDLICFLGAGAYQHYIPAAVDSLLRRGEFYTSYTPYQPEISQGTLQAIFEYQSLICALTGMDASNASHYDGATAAAEAAILAYHHFRGKRGKVILSPALHPHYRATIRTYLQAHKQIEITGDTQPFAFDQHPQEIQQSVDQNTALVLLQYPDFFGRVYDYTDLVSKIHQMGALVAFAVNPIALGLLKSPAEFGADIIVGEGQPLGLPLSFGGPYLGLFACKKEFIRKLAGRLVGETIDHRGNRAYVLTLTAREQHIRREKATSNICTNQGLMALASAIYMSLLGKHGMRQVAELCYHNAHYTAEKITSLPGFRMAYQEPLFNEFVIHTPKPAQEILAHLLDHGILGGYDLGQENPQWKNFMLVAVTEMNTRDEIDVFCQVLDEVSHA